MTIVRPASTKDLVEILAIYNDAIVNTTAVYHYKPHTLEMRTEWFEDKVKNNLPVLVVEVNSQVGGFATYGSFRPWPAYKYSAEHSVYVHTGFRRQGLASMLMKEIIKHAEQREVHTLLAGIDADNAGSIALHQQLGFIQVGHFRQVGYKFEKWLDLQFFQLILQNGLRPIEP